MLQAKGKWVAEQGCHPPFKNTRGGVRDVKDKSVLFVLFINEQPL